MIIYNYLFLNAHLKKDYLLKIIELKEYLLEFIILKVCMVAYGQLIRNPFSLITLVFDMIYLLST